MTWRNGFHETADGRVLVEDDNGQVWVAEEPDTAPRCACCVWVVVEAEGETCRRCAEEGGL